MLSFFYYISAKRRLKEANITIQMMGGEDECQPMIVAQREMLELELEYYRQRSRKIASFMLVILIATVIGCTYFLYERDICLINCMHG